jgi:putative membrane protein
MKFPTFPLAGSALALGALLILAPQSHAAEKNSRLSPVDEQFIQHEAAAGKAFVTIAEDAATRSEDEAIRTFARSLVRDHGKSNASLAKLARAKGVDLESGDFAKHEARFDQLRAERGPAFDREFVALMIEMHKDTAENFKRTATDSPDADIKKWAEEMLPGLRAQLDKAKDLKPSKTASADPSHLIVL